MKYCPYCGTELLNGAASFCTECGKSLTLPYEETDLPRTEEPPQAKTKKRQRGKRRPARTKKQPKRKQTAVPDAPHPEARPEDFGYDGYYDDIVPSDIGQEREGIDKELVKRIAIIAGIVAVIIALCIVALYLL